MELREQKDRNERTGWETRKPLSGVMKMVVGGFEGEVYCWSFETDVVCKKSSALKS